MVVSVDANPTNFKPHSKLLIALRRNPQRNRVVRVIAADVTWVIAAAIVIFGLPGSMSTEGRWALGIVTVAVATYAVLQTIGLRGTEVAESAV